MVFMAGSPFIQGKILARRVFFCYNGVIDL